MGDGNEGAQGKVQKEGGEETKAGTRLGHAAAAFVPLDFADLSVSEAGADAMYDELLDLMR